MERNHFSNSGRGSPKEHFCEIISKLGQWPRRRCGLKVFLLLACCLFSCSAEQNHFRYFSKGSPKEHFCEINLKSGHWPRRRFCLKFFLLLALSDFLFSRAEPF